MGPTLFNCVTNAQKPATLQRSCVWALGVALTGWLISAAAAAPPFLTKEQLLNPNVTHDDEDQNASTETTHDNVRFVVFLLGTWWRMVGCGTVFNYATLLLQLLISEQFLGRVLAVEYTLLVLTEAATASATGRLHDWAGLGKMGLSLASAGVALVALLFWGMYHYGLGWGAASPRFNQYQRPDDHNDNKQGQQFPASKAVAAGEYQQPFEQHTIEEDTSEGLELPNRQLTNMGQPDSSVWA